MKQAPTNANSAKDADFSKKRNVKANGTYHCKNKWNECIYIYLKCRLYTKELTVSRKSSLFRYSRNIDFEYSPRNTFPSKLLSFSSILTIMSRSSSEAVTLLWSFHTQLFHQGSTLLNWVHSRTEKKTLRCLSADSRPSLEWQWYRRS